MFHFKKECCCEGNNSKLKIHQQASIMYVVNSKKERYHSITIDDCDITTGCRCDQGVYLESKNIGLLIELKGSDISHAVTQLTESLQKYKSKLLSLGASIECFIISSNNPLSSTESQIMKVRFKKRHGVMLHIKSSGFSYSYS